MPDGEPGRAELLEALAILEDGLRFGLRTNMPDPSTLAALRAADEAIAENAAAQADMASPAEGVPSASEALGALESRALACTACPLAQGRKKVVFGQGSAAPLVLVVGEGPGAEEDTQGLPFVGASGKLLDKMLAAIGLSRHENCYIANVVKCRPPNNREPSLEERQACLPFLREQIRLLEPSAILCAGRTAAQALLDSPAGINKLRTQTHEYEGIPLVATYHPSALLRDESLKRPAWEDLKRLRALIDRGTSVGGAGLVSKEAGAEPAT
ncbi:MAG TPA: uracil-DNA glycosylase [Rectinemataceae bacterium]